MSKPASPLQLNSADQLSYEDLEAAFNMAMAGSSVVRCGHSKGEVTADENLCRMYCPTCGFVGYAGLDTAVLLRWIDVEKES